MFRLFINRIVVIIFFSFCTLNIFSAQAQGPKTKTVFEKYKIEENDLNKYAVALRAIMDKNLAAQNKIKVIKSGPQMADLLKRKKYAFQSYKDTYINSEESQVHNEILDANDLAVLKKSIFYISTRACFDIIKYFFKNISLYERIGSGFLNSMQAVNDKIPYLSKEIRESTFGNYATVFRKIYNFEKHVLGQTENRRENYNDALQVDPDAIIELAKLYKEINDLSQNAEPGSVDIFCAKFMQDFSLNIDDADYESDLKQALWVSYPIISKIISANCNVFIESAKKVDMLDLLPLPQMPKLEDIKDELKILNIDTSVYKLMQYSSLIMAYYNLVFYNMIIKFIQLVPIVNKIILQGHEDAKSVRRLTLAVLVFMLIDQASRLFVLDQAKIMFYLGDIDDIFPVISKFFRPIECIGGIVSVGTNFAWDTVAMFTTLDDETRLNGLIFTMMYYNVMVFSTLFLNSLAENKGKISEINPLAIVNKMVNANTMLFSILLDLIFGSINFCKKKVQNAKTFYEECCKLRKKLKEFVIVEQQSEEFFSERCACAADWLKE